MSDETKSNLVSFRLSDNDLERLEILANSENLPKSTMAANIVKSFLNENISEFEVNHISYPRPIIEKLFSELTDKQIILMVITTNNYNKEIIESTKSYHTSQEILNSLMKTWKTYGCEVREIKLRHSVILEIHHELERNWSKITSATTSYILELLEYEIKNTFVADGWFKIEYKIIEDTLS